MVKCGKNLIEFNKRNNLGIEYVKNKNIHENTWDLETFSHDSEQLILIKFCSLNGNLIYKIIIAIAI